MRGCDTATNCVLESMSPRESRVKPDILRVHRPQPDGLILLTHDFGMTLGVGCDAGAPEKMPEHFDVLIVGAGLSGIGAAHHLRRRCPRKTYAILEGRDAIGGTWDLFRYPGIRSDSDMYTMGYSFRPWTNPKAIADGPSILNYIRDTASEAGIDRHIRFNHWVTRADVVVRGCAVWTVEAEAHPDAG